MRMLLFGHSCIRWVDSTNSLAIRASVVSGPSTEATSDESMQLALTASVSLEAGPHLRSRMRPRAGLSVREYAGGP